MESRERILLALDRQKPDRLPVTVHGWTVYYLKSYLGGIDQYEAYERFGLDAEIRVGCSYAEFMNPADENWTVTTAAVEKAHDSTKYEHKILTPEGILTYKTESNEYTSWFTEYAIKKPEDVNLIEKYLPVARIDPDLVKRAREKTGNKGIIRGLVAGHQPGPWQDATCWVGTQEMIMHAMDRPDWVHKFLNILLERKLQFIEESLIKCDYDLIELGGGAGSSTVISPSMFKEFCLPYEKKIVSALHKIGLRTVYHTCGGMMPLLEMIVETGTDAMETFSPPDIGGDVDLAEAKKRIGDKVCMLGGVDQLHVLRDETPESIKYFVKKAFKDAGGGGGYIIKACDDFFHVPRENLHVFAETAKECKYE